MKGTTLTLNTKGIVLIFALILGLTFSLGYMFGEKKKESESVVFEKDELNRIVTLQTMEEESGSDAEIFAYKDEDGNLVIGWRKE